MSYNRVIPRDLFNEADLLKCAGRIYINLETAGLENVELVHEDNAFDIQQDENSGDTYISNVYLMINDNPCLLWRPLNSRDPWPVYLLNEDEEQVPVFNKDGSFSQEFIDFVSPAPTDAPAPP